ncbi:GH36-type glycosyl hydrolase domain-containing protein [Lacrimispora sp.]|uniref:GH36-type glycosyl hydrolase domain-containing protein n=1 Tax=Lacrimispora sp. TaxID=2719234 RepID=UPI0028978F32|nr:cellobiose phosphorylase [Lacrimispora sp.]
MKGWEIGMKYEFKGNQGDFYMENPDLTSYLYFPLANESGVMSCVSPDLGGDSKMDQNSFFMPPASCENLHNDKSSRNVWCRVNGTVLWSLTGRSSWQQAQLFSENKEQVAVEAGFMHHKLTRTSNQLGIKGSISSLVPATGEKVELMKIQIENTSEEYKSLQVVTAIPLYARSADNIRDHRHVTSLLHRIKTTSSGVIVTPTMTFDERGHKRNHRAYGVFGGNESQHPVGYYPVLEDFTGEGGNLENPKALYETPLKPQGVDFETGGYEALGGLCFQECRIGPKEKITYLVAMGYGNTEEELMHSCVQFLNETAFDRCWKQTAEYWNQKVNVRLNTGNSVFDRWMRWVSFQPMLRRIYGCSFLPHHDYGKGGRGWRDLWQDCLALLMMDSSGVRQMLIDNFSGVRMDGTNATIIGSGQGEFIADRNNITRVWMDHGVWPFLTTELYIHQTGDLGILLENNSYFKDMEVCRGEEKDLKWKTEDGERLRDDGDQIYSGTVLEHLLVQNLTSFYDVGEHNHIRLRGADWNDALDLASQRGESVAFTCMYGYNLMGLADFLKELKAQGVEEFEVAEEIRHLLIKDRTVYDDIGKKQEVLARYCKNCSHHISGKKAMIKGEELQEDLRAKASWIYDHIRETEWIASMEGFGWYNGYYDNSGNKVEGETEAGVRMMLTSQVFSLMSGVATDRQVREIVEASDAYLYREEIGGYRLNTDFHEVKMDLGRMFGFAYGHKENGAVFSHMATMFGNALYRRNASKEGYHALMSLFDHCSDSGKSRIYPGIPEYVDARGRGMYHYLTGAASWYLVTVVTQMFGIRGHYGNLVFKPQLLKEQFDKQHEASVSLIFAGKNIKVIYKNPKNLDPDTYGITGISLNGIPCRCLGGDWSIKREELLKLPDQELHTITVDLNAE